MEKKPFNHIFAHNLFLWVLIDFGHWIEFGLPKTSRKSAEKTIVWFWYIFVFKLTRFLISKLHTTFGPEN